LSRSVGDRSVQGRSVVIASLGSPGRCGVVANGTAALALAILIIVDRLRRRQRR
jgi:hypothetical protein